MKVFAITTGSVIALLFVWGFIYRDTVEFEVFKMMIKPSHSFAEQTHSTPPDYSNAEHWASLPHSKDNADKSPAGLDLDNQARAPADVFFIHPTTYYSSDNWNQPLDDADANTFTDDQVLPNQASVFNSCCKIYAPRYRQATLYSFLDEGEDGPAALALAYEDVKTAFNYFIKHYNNKRPFILAGHSQGGKHADTLLTELISGTDLQDRMIAAYPIGHFYEASNGIPVCNYPGDTGCQVTWNSMAPNTPRTHDASNDLCVNPINWLSDGTRAGFEENIGAVSFAAASLVEPGTADAQCINGELIVTEVRSDNFDGGTFGAGNYHIYDFSFFHMNIRANAEQRVQSFLNP